MEEDASQEQRTKTQTSGKKTWHWCMNHIKCTVHKPKDCDLCKKQDQQANKNQDNQWQVRANQAPYAEMLTKLAQLSINE